MKMNKTYLYFLFLLLIISSCTKDFPYDLDYNKKIAVNCVLMPDSSVVVLLEYAYPIDSSSVEFEQTVKGAYVEISDDYGNKTVLSEKSDYVANGFFSSTVADVVYFSDQLLPQPGRKYYLKVYVDGFDTIYASTVVPYAPDVDTVTYYYYEDEEIPDGYHYIFDVSVHFNDTLSEYNYFFLIQALNNTTKIFTDDPAKEASYLGYLFSDRIFNNHPYTLNFTYSYEDISWYKDEGKIYFYQVNEDFFRFMYSAIRQIPPEIPNPYQEPTIIHTNIENGVGIFCAVSRPYIINLVKNK